MSTGYYTRVSNTVVSGNDLLAALNGEDVRALQFESKLAVGPVKTLALTTTANTLDANNWVDSINNQLYLNASAGTSYIVLGSDMPSIAKQYQNLFNLTTTSEVRQAKFTLQNTAASQVLLQVGAAVGASTSTYVKAALDGTVAATAQMFTGISATMPTTGYLSAGAGSTRIVLVSGDNFTSGSETITFNVLSGSF